MNLDSALGSRSATSMGCNRLASHGRHRGWIGAWEVHRLGEDWQANKCCYQEVRPGYSYVDDCHLLTVITNVFNLQLVFNQNTEQAKSTLWEAPLITCTANSCAFQQSAVYAAAS